VIGVSIFGIMKKLRLNNKVRKACQGSSRGFGMIEIVIAIALIGVIAVAVLSALATASMALIIADERATAESLARSQIEYVKDNNENPYDFDDPQSYEQPDVESLDHPGYFISVSAEPLRNPDDGIQKITVTVSRDGEVKVTLEDYKRNPEI
jgi:prepilin-type N-terminal cleavage/methylation domain-containing protein